MVIFLKFEIALTKMPKTKTNVGLRHEAIGLHRGGLSVQKIAEKLGVSPNFVQNTIIKHRAGHSLNDAPKVQTSHQKLRQGSFPDKRRALRTTKY